MPPKLISAFWLYVGGAAAAFSCAALAVVFYRDRQLWPASVLAIIALGNAFTVAKLFVVRRRLKRSMAFLYAIHHPEGQ